MRSATTLAFALVLRTADMTGDRCALAGARARILFVRPFSLARVETAAHVGVAQKRTLLRYFFILRPCDGGYAGRHSRKRGQGQFSKMSSAEITQIRHYRSPVNFRGSAQASGIGERPNLRTVLRPGRTRSLPGRHSFRLNSMPTSRRF